MRIEATNRTAFAGYLAAPHPVCVRMLGVAFGQLALLFAGERERERFGDPSKRRWAQSSANSPNRNTGDCSITPGRPARIDSSAIRQRLVKTSTVAFQMIAPNPGARAVTGGLRSRPGKLRIAGPVNRYLQ